LKRSTRCKRKTNKDPKKNGGREESTGGTPIAAGPFRNREKAKEQEQPKRKMHVSGYGKDGKGAHKELITGPRRRG